MGKIPNSIWSVFGGGLRQIGGIAIDEYSREASEHVLICPVCGFNCAHITGVQKDDPRGWGSYGNVSIEIWGECGHRWTIFFNDHKGAVLVASHFNRVVSDWPPSDPDDEETDREEADEPPRQNGEQDPADASEGEQMKIHMTRRSPDHPIGPIQDGRSRSDRALRGILRQSPRAFQLHIRAAPDEGGERQARCAHGPAGVRDRDGRIQGRGARRLRSHQEWWRCSVCSLILENITPAGIPRRRFRR